MRFIVSRRITATSKNLVEINHGRVRPDALRVRYPGEGVSFTYHREAQMAAYRIVDLWQQDVPQLKIEYGG